MKKPIKLKRYHKQNWSKNKIKELDTLNKKYELKLNCKNIDDLLSLQIFKESLKNKGAFEREFNKFHQTHRDMWTNMTFNERNFFIHKDMKKLKKSLKSFQFNDKRIHIAFFNELLNVLYDEETAILELPQYFKLYDDFNQEIIKPGFYGLKPLMANMAWPQFINNNEDCVVLFDEDIQIFFKVNQKECKTYPLYKGSEIDQNLQNDLAAHLLNDEFDNFYQSMFDNSLMSPRLKRVYKRRMKRRAR